MLGFSRKNQRALDPDKRSMLLSMWVSCQGRVLAAFASPVPRTAQHCGYNARMLVGVGASFINVVASLNQFLHRSRHHAGYHIDTPAHVLGGGSSILLSSSAPLSVVFKIVVLLDAAFSNNPGGAFISVCDCECHSSRLLSKNFIIFRLVVRGTLSNVSITVTWCLITKREQCVFQYCI